MIEYNFILMQTRLFKPLVALVENFEIKFGVATLISALYAILAELKIVLASDATYVTALVLLITIDFITGIYSSFKSKIPITSLGIRSTFVKSIEYMFVLIPLTILSNMALELSWIQTWAYVFVCATEIKSIGENIPSMNKMFTSLWAIIKDRNKVDVS